MQPAYLPVDLAPLQELTVRDYLAILKRYRATFLGVFLLVLVAGIVLTVRTPSVYRTTAILSVKSISPPAANLVEAGAAKNSLP